MKPPRDWSGIALNPNSHSHYTDHLAAVAVLMDIPLLFTETDQYEDAQRCYPGLQAEVHDWTQLKPQYFADRYTTYFVSEMWKPAQLKARFGTAAYYAVHCPHGFSDKGYWFAECVEQEVTLAYGQNMLDLIQLHNPAKSAFSHVLSGNLRYDYYLRNQKFYDQLVAEEILWKFPKKQPIILYAPTWNDREQSTSFYEAADMICASLPAEYNLIVKLHPNLQLDNKIALIYALMGKYQKSKNILFLEQFTPIYPLLAICDLYIGDRSAVGYDFLAFNRPMYFLNPHHRDPKTDRGVYLFRCGIEIPPQEYGQLYETIEKTLPLDQEQFGAIRKEVYDYSFVHRPWSEIKAEILRATCCSL